MTTQAQLLAGAVGGPTAATEYGTAAASAGSADQAALHNLAIQSGAMHAPAAFMPAEAGQLNSIASAAKAAAGTAGSANGAGQINGAVTSYRDAIEQLKPRIQQIMQVSNEMPFTGAAAKTQQEVLGNMYQEHRDLKSLSAPDNTGTIQNTLNRAAVSGLNPTAYSVLHGVLTNAKSAPEALQNLDAHLVVNTDGTPLLDDSGQPMYTDNGKQTGTLIPHSDIAKIESQILPAFGLNVPQVEGPNMYAPIGKPSTESVLQNLYGGGAAGVEG